MPNLQAETSKSDSTRRRWVRFKDLPFSRMFAYKLIQLSEITTVKFIPPGSKKGIVLIDQDSLDRFLEKQSQAQGRFVPAGTVEAQAK
jgi:hypothetical protein